MLHLGNCFTGMELVEVAGLNPTLQIEYLLPIGRRCGGTRPVSFLLMDSTHMLFSILSTYFV